MNSDLPPQPAPDSHSSGPTSPAAISPVPEDPWAEPSCNNTAVAPPPMDWGKWVRRFLWYNPFFLASAAMMLYGVFRLSSDPTLFHEEGTNLLFCFLSLQLYAFLGIGTALILARRRVWYDSALLVVLEHGLVLVPFLLISQAALLEVRFGWVLVWTAMWAAMARVGMVRRWYPQFRFPRRLALLGFGILLLNGVVPMILRSMVNRSSVDDWEGPNRLAWNLVLPGLALAGAMLPRPRPSSSLESDRPWIPILLHGLWVSATAVHVWSLAYIAKQTVAAADLAPLITTVIWTVFLRSSDFFLISPLPWTRCLWFGATVAPLLGISRGSTFLTLVAIQTAVFFSLALGGDRRLRPTARELSGVSLVLWMAMTPLGWWRESFPGMDRPECVLLAVGVYLLLQCCRLRSSLAGLMAAMVTMAGISALVPRGWAEPLAVQTGLALFLAHGMFWRQRGFSGAGRILRLIAALLWMVMAWFQHPPLGWGVQSIITLEAMVVLSLWGWRTRAIESPVEWGVPMGAMAAILIPPVQWSLGHLTPGLFAVVGSFVLFGLGIGAAWSRSLWASHSMTPSVISEAENRNTIIDS